MVWYGGEGSSSTANLAVGVNYRRLMDNAETQLDAAKEESPPTTPITKWGWLVWYVARAHLKTL